MTNGVLSFAGRLPDKNGSSGAAGPGESREARAAGGFVRIHSAPGDAAVRFIICQRFERQNGINDTSKAMKIAAPHSIAFGPS